MRVMKVRISITPRPLGTSSRSSWVQSGTLAGSNPAPSSVISMLMKSGETAHSTTTCFAGSSLLPWTIALTIASSADYFPDTIGSRWTYRGQLSEGPLQTIENKFFTNVSTVTGTKTIKGVAVTVQETGGSARGGSVRFTILIETSGGRRAS